MGENWCYFPGEFNIFTKMDLDAILDEAAETTFKPEPVVAKRKADPAEIKPWLASTALVTPQQRDRWNAMVRKDYEATATTKFLPSKAYQAGEPSATVNTNKMLYDYVKTASARCQFDESKTSKLLSLVNPAADNDTVKQLQPAYRKQLLQTLKNDILSDPNYTPERFPHLAQALSQE